MPTRFDPRERVVGGSRSLVDSWLNRSFINTIQYRSFAVNGVAAATDTITSVNLSNTILIPLAVTTDTAGPNPSGANVRIALTNATTVTGTTSGTAQNHVVNYIALEFIPGVIRSVQAATITITGVATTNTATVTSVNTAKAVLFNLGQSLDAADDRLLARLTLTSATVVTATLNTGSLGTSITSFQLAEFF